MSSQHNNEYLETTEFPGNTHLEISVYYSKGGMNYFNGRSEARGFYLSVTPVKKEKHFISTEVFSGIKKFIFPVSRYSQNQHTKAIELSKEYTQELIDYLRTKQKGA